MARRRFAYTCMLSGIAGVIAASTLLSGSALTQTFTGPRDPGVRGGPADAGGPLPGLTAAEAAFFDAGKDDFAEAEGVGDGLGPRFNLDACGGCHAQPATGGTSPAINPQVAVATAGGANNVVPSFIKRDGPVREARFVKNPDGSPDGGVHALFVISGRTDDTGSAATCNATQENFEKQVFNKNIIFRIPTPVFGDGLIESIEEGKLIDNLGKNCFRKSQLGISGRLNHNGNDGRVSRFGWKAQNQSLLLFSGEAYNVEMGITNELFQVERDENPTCQFATVPNDTQLFDTTAGFPALITAIENFANFQRFLDQPKPDPGPFTTKSGKFVSSGSVTRGSGKFSEIGCALCHTPSLQTSDVATIGALRNKTANLFSDVALHNMGPGLADRISQGEARGDEFRTAPLWGLGQRIFFLHDGRTDDLIEAIKAHRSNATPEFRASEANKVID